MTCKSIITTFHSFLNAADFFKNENPNPPRFLPQPPPGGAALGIGGGMALRKEWKVDIIDLQVI